MELGLDGNNTVATTLDDYEEGAYVPRLCLHWNILEPSYAWRYGQYVKIGEFYLTPQVKQLPLVCHHATQTYISSI